ncbi:acyl carrier protein [bacterium]|nr:MAG: acyl carrier protein [bacterium]RIK60146.1 MAG: hypothetical protein DCC64_14875 [Planctomycetota bacterium]
MHDFGFFISILLAGGLAYFVAGLLDARRRLQRRDFVESRPAIGDGEFRLGVSAISPVDVAFCRAFRLAVSRALGVPAERLDPRHRLLADLRVFGFDAMELAATLERAFDVRVRVLDVMRSDTLRRLALVIHERLAEISEHEPPLHRDPVPKMRAPEDPADVQEPRTDAATPSA